MAGDPQISVASLKADIDQMRNCGFWPKYVECGQMVFELLCNWTLVGNKPPFLSYWSEDRILAWEERKRAELFMGLTDMSFNEMPVRYCEDVPDGRFWPAREHGGYINRPFSGTEAFNAHDSANA